METRQLSGISSTLHRRAADTTGKNAHAVGTSEHRHILYLQLPHDIALKERTLKVPVWEFATPHSQRRRPIEEIGVSLIFRLQ